MVERAAGLDVHQASIVACVLIGRPGYKPRKEIRHFGTMTADLEALRDWLRELGVTHVGMESTGVGIVKLAWHVPALEAESPDAFPPRKATRTGALARAPGRSGEVQDPGMCGRSLNGNRDISRPTGGRQLPNRPASGRRGAVADDERP
jgi:transposase